METPSSTAQCRLMCSIHNIPYEDSSAERWIRTVLESEFQVDHCQRIEGKSVVQRVIISKYLQRITNVAYTLAADRTVRET